MKEINFLYADREHEDMHSGAFYYLVRKYPVKIERANSLTEYKKEILEKSEGKDILLIHPGTRMPMAGIKELMVEIKKRNPNIKIGLETEVKHPDLENIIDFYITNWKHIEDFCDQIISNVS